MKSAVESTSLRSGGGLALTLFVSVRTLALVAVILHYGSQWARTLRAEGVLRVVNQCKQALLRVRADEYI